LNFLYYRTAPIVRYALAHLEVAAVTAIGRRKVGVAHPKLNEVPLPGPLSHFATGQQSPG